MEQISITVLAVAIAIFAAPLFVDLAICIVGNFRRARRPNAAVCREIKLAVVVPAHNEEAMIGRTLKFAERLLGLKRGFMWSRTIAKMRPRKLRCKPVLACWF